MVAAGNLIRATDLNNLVRPYYAFSTGSNTFSAGSANVRQDITGLTFDVVTVNANAMVVVTYAVDCNVTTTQVNNSFQFRLEVDGAAQQGFASIPTDTLGRGTATQCLRITHASPGTFNYKVTGICGNANAAAVCSGGISNMVATVIDLAA